MLLPTHTPRTALSPEDMPNKKSFGVDIRGEKESFRKSIYPDNIPAVQVPGTVPSPKRKPMGSRA